MKQKFAKRVKKSNETNQKSATISAAGTGETSQVQQVPSSKVSYMVFRKQRLPIQKYLMGWIPLIIFRFEELQSSDLCFPEKAKLVSSEWQELKKSHDQEGI